jgi:osmoprotectant transport system ATP-binding protein
VAQPAFGKHYPDAAPSQIPVNAGGTIELRGVRKVYPNGHAALKGITLRVEAGTTLALLGPSGCGKTTTLKLINRLVAPTEGTILVDGRDVSRLDPVTLRRGMGYVVQEAGLFPHLTARDNVEIVPRLLGWPAARRHARAEELLRIVGLDVERHACRFPAELSGGERQRVGLARALAADPPLVLMDEPFGAVDPITRRRLQQEFLGLERQLRKTIVLVTHDVEEAFLLAHRVAVMCDGAVAQVGTPEELRANPADDFVAHFLGIGQ